MIACSSLIFKTWPVNLLKLLIRAKTTVTFELRLGLQHPITEQNVLTTVPQLVKMMVYYSHISARQLKVSHSTHTYCQLPDYALNAYQVMSRTKD
jgi:hypothetical protein